MDRQATGVETLRREQRALNRATEGSWSLFAEHRARLMEWIERAGAGGRLAVVGAGNCNDLDLRWLAASFQAVDLIDIDADAVQAALRRQDVAAGRVRVRSLDVGGLGDLIDTAPSAARNEGGLETILARAEAGGDLGPEEYDMIVSAGVLTQLMRSIGDPIGPDHPRIVDVASAVRAGHLRTLLRAVRPGGRVLVATEVVSNEVIPAVASAPDEALGSLLFRAIWKGDLFTGVSPAALVSWLVQNRPFGARLVRPGLVGPWRWWQAPSRAFLVVGITVGRAGEWGSG